jgi:Tol biopolymer transport system component
LLKKQKGRCEMKRLDGYRIRLVLFGFVAAMVLGGGSAKADFTFGEPTNLGPVINSPALEAHPSISADGLSLFFYSERSGGYGNRDVWVARRATTNEGWTMLENVGPPVNTSYRDSGPGISFDGLTLFFDSDRPGGSGSSDLWVTTRPVESAPWGTPVNLGRLVNGPSYDAYPSVSAGGLTLFMQSDRPGGYGGYDTWMMTRETKDDPWTAPVNPGATINSSAHEGDPSISSDGLELFFASARPVGYGGWDLYLARRATTQDPWGPPTNLGPVVNSSSAEFGPSVAADGSTFYFGSLRSGAGDLFEAPIIRIVDFNADGIVDAADVGIMIEHWHTDHPLCDIGLMPWGDGIVDVKDLVALAEHLFEKVDDPTLIAHWALDEAQGEIAYDSAGDSDGILTRGPAWQPEGGQLGGALELDGVDDCVTTPFILNPADGPFSVFAWIKGGAPGQVVISQADGANWLMANAEGKLMTQLQGSGRSAGPLRSQTIITDGQWHRIALVWDGSRRSLYVDGTVAAEDTQSAPPSSGNGLDIGTGKNMEPGTFWSGLIDDVRIYDRAVKP